MHVGINEFGVEFVVNWCMHVHVYVKSMISPCFEKNWLFRASNWSFEMICIHACLHVLHILENGFECGFNWLTFGAWILKLSFETCYTLNLVKFSRIWAQEVEFGVVECLAWAWEADLEIPDVASSLERRIPRASENLCPGIRSSDHRATIARKITASSIFLLFRQTARAKDFSLERILWFWSYARAEKVSLERSPYFQQSLQNVF